MMQLRRLLFGAALIAIVGLVAASYLQRQALILYPTTDGNEPAVTTSEGPRKIYFFSSDSQTMEEVVQDISYSQEALIEAWLNASKLPAEVQITCSISYPDAEQGTEDFAGSSISFHHAGTRELATVEISKEFYQFVSESDIDAVIESLKKSLRTTSGPEFFEDEEMEFLITIGGEEFS